MWAARSRYHWLFFVVRMGHESGVRKKDLYRNIEKKSALVMQPWLEQNEDNSYGL